jgi:hypothetical protein
MLGLAPEEVQSVAEATRVSVRQAADTTLVRYAGTAWAPTVSSDISE